MAIPSYLQELDGAYPILSAVLVPLAVFFVFNILISFSKKEMLKRAKSRKNITTIQLAHKVAKYIVFIIIAWVALLSYTGAFTGLGLSLGLFSVIIAWTFMRPLLGIVAWIAIVIKRPFGIGDRIEINSIKGDVEDLTLTHIYIRQTGGLVKGSEDAAGSLVIIPNAFFFEHPITNYTDRENYVLQEVDFVVSHESDVDLATKIGVQSALKILKKEIPGYDREPFVRTLFEGDGIGIHVRFFAPAQNVARYVSDVSYLIMKGLKKTRKVKLVKSSP